jgi:DNA-binding transcriptional LysR family regulator
LEHPIGFPGSNLDPEALTATVLFRSPVCVLCSEHRWPKERTPPSLADFRYDNFLAFVPEFSPDYAAMVRDFCLREAGFEPKIEPVANSDDSILSMVAAGRGIFLRPLIGPSEHPSTVNCYVLDEVQTKLEVSLMQNKSEATPTMNNFVEILRESVRRLKVSG